MQRSEGVIFRSDDGREIEEADLRAVVDCFQRARVMEPEPWKRILAALAPKPTSTCGAMLVVETYDCQGQTHRGPYFRCVLPPGHHPYESFLEPGTDDWVCINCPSGEDRSPEDPIHAPGHMPSADSWVVPNE